MTTAQLDLIPPDAATAEVFETKAAWLAGRRLGIGASEAPAVVGICPWKRGGAAQLYAEKLELVEADAVETEAMEWGLLLEPVIRARYVHLTGRRVVAAGPTPWTVHRSRAYPFMTATLDGLVQDPARGLGVFQAKTTGAFHADAWEDGPPLHYQVQVQHEMAVAGVAWGVLAVLIGGQAFRSYEIARNDAFLAELVRAEGALWDRMVKQDPPPIGAGAHDLVRRLYPRATPGLVVNLPGEAVEWDAERSEALRELARWKTVKDEAETRIKAAIGEAEAGVCPNGVTFTWKLVEKKGCTVAPTSYRDFRRKEGSPA